MSSFRADAAWHPPEFVPMPLTAGTGEFVDATGQRSARARADVTAEDGDRTRADAVGAANAEEAPALDPVWSQERIEELERAAFARGEESARLAAETLAQACGTLERAAAELVRAAGSRLSRNREAMLELSAEIAKHWVGAELSLDPSRFERALDRVLSEMEEDTDVWLHIRPEARSALEASAEERLRQWQEAYGLRLETDDRLEPGGFRVESATRAVDANPSTLRDRLIEALSGAVEAAPPEASP